MNNQALMSPREASAYADKILTETADALNPRPRLVLNSEFGSVGPCLGGPNAANLVVVERLYWVRGITAKDFKTVGEQVLAYWRHRRWLINGTNGVGTTKPEIYAIAPPYAFNVALNWGKGATPAGQLSFDAASVCLPPHKTSPGK